MAVDPPECSGSSPPPGGLRHTPGHLKLLHLKQEDKEGPGVALDRPRGPGTQGCLPAPGGEVGPEPGLRGRLCGRRNRERAGRGFDRQRGSWRPGEQATRA